MWDGLADAYPLKINNKISENAIRSDFLKTIDQHPCLVLLTETELLWNINVNQPACLPNRISLNEVVFVNTLFRFEATYSAIRKKKLESKTWISLDRRLFSLGFVVGVIHRTGKHNWKTREVIFLCTTEQDVQAWIRQLNCLIRLCVPNRPHKLLVFVNPNAGRKRAEYIYSKTVEPLFELAGVCTKVVVTTHRGHATDYLLNKSLDTFDGVVCVGGDGFLSEVIQGLLLRERAKADLPLYSGHLPGDVEIPCSTHIGIISAGSTDTVAFSTQGTNDVLTSVLHIITGDSLPLDVTAMHSLETGAFVRYVVSMAGYGFHADLLKSDDKHRWMGPRRYDYSGFATFLQHSVYKGELSYLPSSNLASHPMDNVQCVYGCSVCSRRLESLPFPKFSRDTCTKGTHNHKPIGLSSTCINGNVPSTTQSCVKLGDALITRSQDSIAFTKKEMLSRVSNDNRKKIPHIADHRRVSSHLATSSGSLPTPSATKLNALSTHTLSQSTVRTPPSWTTQSCVKGWRTISGTFLAINAFSLSCRCKKAPFGPSPWAHLGDGCLDLVLIRNCSRKGFLQFLLRTAHNRSPFTLPFVSVLRVCAFEFRAPPTSSAHSQSDEMNGSTTPTHRRCPFPHSACCHDRIHGRCPESIWCADGELVPHNNISVFVHRHLIRLYARGPEPICSSTRLSSSSDIV